MAVGSMETTTARTQLALAYTVMGQHSQGNQSVGFLASM